MTSPLPQQTKKQSAMGYLGHLLQGATANLHADGGSSSTNHDLAIAIPVGGPQSTTRGYRKRTRDEATDATDNNPVVATAVSLTTTNNEDSSIGFPPKPAKPVQPVQHRIAFVGKPVHRCISLDVNSLLKLSNTDFSLTQPSSTAAVSAAVPTATLKSNDNSFLNLSNATSSWAQPSTTTVLLSNPIQDPVAETAKVITTRTQPSTTAVAKRGKDPVEPVAAPMVALGYHDNSFWTLSNATSSWTQTSSTITVAKAGPDPAAVPATTLGYRDDDFTESFMGPPMAKRRRIGEHTSDSGFHQLPNGTISNGTFGSEFCRVSSSDTFGSGSQNPAFMMSPQMKNRDSVGHKSSTTGFSSPVIAATAVAAAALYSSITGSKKKKQTKKHQPKSRLLKPINLDHQQRQGMKWKETPSLSEDQPDIPRSDPTILFPLLNKKAQVESPRPAEKTVLGSTQKSNHNNLTITECPPALACTPTSSPLQSNLHGNGKDGGLGDEPTGNDHLVHDHAFDFEGASSATDDSLVHDHAFDLEGASSATDDSDSDDPVDNNQIGNHVPDGEQADGGGATNDDLPLVLVDDDKAATDAGDDPVDSDQFGNQVAAWEKANGDDGRLSGATDDDLPLVLVDDDKAATDGNAGDDPVDSDQFGNQVAAGEQADGCGATDVVP